MFEWRESLSFVGVEASVISCLGSQEAGTSVQASVCVCVCDVHQGEGHELKQTKHSWIILFRQLPVLVIYTLSTCCSCAAVRQTDKQLPLSHHLIPLVAPQSQRRHIYCVCFCRRSKRHSNHSSYLTKLTAHTCEICKES